MIILVSTVNDRATKTLVTIIKDNRLSRSNRPRRIIKINRQAVPVFFEFNCYRNILLPVAKLCRTTETVTIPADNVINPVNIACFQVRRIKRRVLITLTYV